MAKPKELGKSMPTEVSNADVKGGRIFSKTVEIFSDLFKLEVAKVIKGIGIAEHPDDAPNDFVGFEHTHPYRTKDSDGKSHVRSASIAGHYHVMELEPNPLGPDHPPVVKSCSPPMKLVRRKVKGQWALVDEQANDYDDHVHEVTYLRSDKVQARTTNVEAQRVLAWEAQKGASVPGVVPK